MISSFALVSLASSEPPPAPGTPLGPETTPATAWGDGVSVGAVGTGVDVAPNEVPGAVGVPGNGVAVSPCGVGDGDDVAVPHSGVGDGVAGPPCGVGDGDAVAGPPCGVGDGVAGPPCGVGDGVAVSHCGVGVGDAVAVPP